MPRDGYLMLAFMEKIRKGDVQTDPNNFQNLIPVPTSLHGQSWHPADTKAQQVYRPAP